MKYCPQCKRSHAITATVCQTDGTPLVLKDTYGVSGRIIADKYQIGDLAALGGMSAVYHAHQIGVKRHVAFKILLPNLALEHPRMLDRFEREAHLAGLLTHENIAVIHDAGQTADHLAYIVMEWLDGALLEAELRRSHYLSYQRIAYLLRQIAAALDAAHAARVIHRDLKPTNIMVTPRPDGRAWVKVFDFGLAKVLTESMDLQISHALGTPHYASPEQFRPGEEISGQSDIYSLGVILYRMLTRCVPFDAPDIHEVIRLHLLEMPPPLTRLRPDVPVAVEELVNRMLAKTPHYRPATAHEAVELFEQAIAHLPLAERQRELPVKSKAGAPAKPISGTRPLTAPRSRKAKARSNSGALARARQAATFNQVRQTKHLDRPLSVTPKAKAATLLTTPAQAPASQPQAKPIAPKKLQPMPVNFAQPSSRLLLLAVVILLLAALAGYFIFSPTLQLAWQRQPLTNLACSPSPSFDLTPISRRNL